jgi:hypothetical protein
MVKRLTALLATGLVGFSILSVSLTATRAVAADTPLPTTPYQGFNPSLTRAPYVTDLTQTSAYVNWATTSDVPGSVAVVAAGAGGCPSSIAWSPSAIGAPTSLPGPVNPTSPTGTMTGWQFTVTGATGSTLEYQASVPVTGLSAATTYCYTVYSTDNAGAVDLLPPSKQVQSFTTLDPVNTSSTTPVTFDVIDDTGENYQDTCAATTPGCVDNPFPGGVNPDQASLYSQIGRSGADFLVSVGDIAYSGATQSTFGDLEQTGTEPEVSNFFGPDYYPLSGGIPIFAGSGDHGQNINPLKIFPTRETAIDSSGTYAYDSYSGNVDGITASAPDDWYAFSTGNVRVYVIDGAWADGVSGRLGTTTGSLCGSVGATALASCQAYQADADEHLQTTSPEYKWLAADLAAHPGGVKFAVFHFPLRSVNASQPSDPYLQNSSANPHASTSLEKLLASNGVDIAFNGHAHTYQRIVPNNYKQNDQMINYVTGGGGGVLEPVVGGTCSTLQATASIYALGWDAGTNTGSACGAGVPTPGSAADVYSFLKVTVSGSNVTVAPTDAAGQTFDVQTYSLPSSGSGTSPAPPTTTVTSAPPAGPSGPSSTPCMSHLPVGAVVAAAALPSGAGYYEVDSAGDVAAFGGAVCHGAMTGIPLNRPIVGMAVDPSTGGYWLVATDGGIFSFDAPFKGSTGAIRLNQPIVGMAADPATGGYWMVASDGGIFSFGAPFYGSTGDLVLNKPVVGMGVDPATGGYWLVASDGGVFSFHAPFFGSTGNIRLNKPIVGIDPTASGTGYRLVASDGGVFSGNVPFYGSAGNLPLVRPIVAGVNDNATGGYWLVASDGGVFSYHAPFFGSAA